MDEASWATCPRCSSSRRCVQGFVGDMSKVLLLAGNLCKVFLLAGDVIKVSTLSGI